MKYALLFYMGNGQPGGLPSDAFCLQAEDIATSLGRSGQCLGMALVDPGQRAMTVRRRDGDLCTADVGVEAGSGQLKGIMLVETCDRLTAIALAASLLPASHGSIEVRPVRNLELSKREDN